MTTAVAIPNAVERWHALIRARAEQMDAAYAKLGRTSHDYWSRRASAFHKATKDTARRDPIFRRLRRAVSADSTVIDVGAGTGRFTLALAPLVRRVVAVEPSEGMRGLLEAQARRRKLSNVEVIGAEWEAAPGDLQGDVVLCAHVLYQILDIAGFLAKLDAATLGTCFVYMRADHPDRVSSPLWEHFHGEPRRLSPTYIAALDVLFEMGILADVEVVGHRPNWLWDSIDHAVDEFLDMLILPDTPDTRAELAGLLRGFLISRDGALSLPIDNLPSAIMSWRK